MDLLLFIAAYNRQCGSHRALIVFGETITAATVREAAKVFSAL